MAVLRDAYYQYLVSMGYSEYTKSGRKSTVYSYCNRIDLVCKTENLTWEQLAEYIDSIIPKYEVGGIHQDIGLRSQRTGINALYAFRDFSKQ